MGKQRRPQGIAVYGLTRLRIPSLTAVLDSQSFLHEFRPDISPDTTFDVQFLDGGENEQLQGSAGDEAVSGIENDGERGITNRSPLYRTSTYSMR